MVPNAGTSNTLSPEERVVALWRKYGSSAVGRRFYSFLFGRMVPYTGTVRPLIQEIEPGRAVVRIKDRRSVRNHLRSIHAIALANVGELASGLAMIAALPKEVRAIVTNLEIEYSKKARGTLVATGQADPPDTVTDPVTLPAYAVIRAGGGDTVASVTVHWLLSPRESA